MGNSLSSRKTDSASKEIILSTATKNDLWILIKPDSSKKASRFDNESCVTIDLSEQTILT